MLSSTTTPPPPTPTTDKTETLTEQAKAAIMKRHTFKLIQQLRNEKINHVLRQIIDIKDDEDDLIFASQDSLLEPQAHSEAHDKCQNILRKKKQTEREVVFKVQELLIKTSTMLENQLKMIDGNAKEKHTKQCDELSHIIRGQAGTIQILQQKLNRWREAKEKQNQTIKDLQQQVHQYKVKIDTDRIEMDKIISKTERVESMHQYSSNKMAEKEEKFHKLSGQIGILRFELNAAKRRLKRTEEHAGVEHAEMLEQKQAFETGYADLVTKQATELSELRTKSEYEYNGLSEILSHERKKRIHNEAQQNVLIEELQVNARDLHKHNHDLLVDVEAMKVTILDLERRLRYSTIQKRFGLSLKHVREKKEENNEKKDEKKEETETQKQIEEEVKNTIAPTPIINVFKQIVMASSKDNNPEPATNSEPDQNDDGEGHHLIHDDSEGSLWDDFKIPPDRNRFDKYEKTSMKLKPTPSRGIVGPSELYMQSFKYYRPAIKHPTINSIQLMISKNIIANAKAREKKYIWGWQYMVEQYKRLIYFQDISKNGHATANNERILLALSYGRMNAKMAKKQWKKLRMQIHQKTHTWWNYILNGCVELTNEVNGLKERHRRGGRKRSKTPRQEWNGDDRGDGGTANVHVALDDVVIHKRVAPLAHFDSRRAVESKNTVTATRPRTAGRIRGRRKTSRHTNQVWQAPRSSSVVVPKRPSTARSYRRRKNT